MADPVSNERRRLSLGSTRQRWILLAALAPPTAWAISVWHYTVNAPFQDDWSVTPVVSASDQGVSLYRLCGANTLKHDFRSRICSSPLRGL